MACCVCRQPHHWAWQPFGPGESPRSFMTPGSHYRGFPVLMVCEECRKRIKAGQETAFVYKKVPYVYTGTTDTVVKPHL